MCTALSLNTRDHYFGRTLDLDCSYGEEVVVMPRKYPLTFRRMGERTEHFAMIGMAAVVAGVPLFYDAVNEHGLCMAGLNFPKNAFFHPIKEDKDNISPFEFIPWILGQCKTVAQARTLLDRINLADIPFSDRLPLSPLHWMISDRTESIVIESMRDGLHIYINPDGVMTNNPPFPRQLENLEKYTALRTDNGNAMSLLPEEFYCQGLGAVGLPGDVSSMSRFVRIAFGRRNSVCDRDETSSVSQFFHLLSSVEMVKGTCLTDAKTWDYTVYTSCANADKGLYYYTTYGNRRINCVDMHRVDLDGEVLYRYPLKLSEEISYQN